MMSNLLKNLCRFLGRRASFWVCRLRTPSPSSDLASKPAPKKLWVQFSPPPKIVLSLFIHLLDDCLIQLENAHEVHWEGGKDGVSNFKTTCL
jgi:hypothetical protein